MARVGCFCHIADPRCWKATLQVKFVYDIFCGQNSSSFCLLHKFVTATDVWYAGCAAVAAKHRAGGIGSAKQERTITSYLQAIGDQSAKPISPLNISKAPWYLYTFVVGFLVGGGGFECAALHYLTPDITECHASMQFLPNLIKNRQIVVLHVLT